MVQARYVVPKISNAQYTIYNLIHLSYPISKGVVIITIMTK